MIRQCVTCGDQAAGGGKLCPFCERFGVSRSAAPNPVIRRRVMREIEAHEARAQGWAKVADASMREARWWRRCAGAMLVATIAALAFAVMMLNALPSASASPAPRGLVDVRAERLLQAWCPASMPRRHCVGWMRVAQCETGGQQIAVSYRSLRQIRWRYNGASGYDGALQFGARTWRASVNRIGARKLTREQYAARERGAYGLAFMAPPAVQVLAADALRVRTDGGGLGHWPSCGGRW